MGALDALTLATAEDWEGMLVAFGELAGVDDPVAALGPGPHAGWLRQDRGPSRPGRTGDGDAGARRPGADPGAGLDAELHPDGFGCRRDVVGAGPS